MCQKFEESKIAKTPMNFDNDIELPAILDVELLKDKTEEDKNENIKVNIQNSYIY